METQTLGQFIAANRNELLRRCRTKVAARPEPSPTEAEIERGIPQFLDDIVAELSDGPSQKIRMGQSATQHGSDLFFEGFTVGQVVHDYGAVCQSVTDLAVELNAPITADDFRTLNRCLDDSIAGAVSQYVRHERTGDAMDQSMTLRNLIETAIQAFEVLQSGKVGVDGATGALVHRCLLSMRQVAPILK
jgi:hypothetical protein